MPNNRLYFVDTVNKTYVCLARMYFPWYVADRHRETGRSLSARLDELLSGVYDESSKQFILVSEDMEQDDLYQEYITKGTEII
jgi:hypothetical protein